MINKLKDLGWRITPQRMAIIKYLEGNTSHPSVEDIYRHLKPEFPSLSMATVYNTLQSLAEARVIQEINIEPGKRHFDPNPQPHGHFYCHKCKRVFDVNLEVPYLEVPRWLEGFWVENFSVNLIGNCPDCLKRVE